MPRNNAYDTDFYAWATDQAALLCAGDLAGADTRGGVLALLVLAYCYSSQSNNNRL